jgi:hypothetical protein
VTEPATYGTPALNQAITDLLNKAEHVHLVTTDDSRCLSLPTCPHDLTHR